MRVVFEDPGRELGDETRGLAGGFARAPRAERFLIQQHNISGQDNRFVGPARFCYPPTRMKHCQSMSLPEVVCCWNDRLAVQPNKQTCRPSDKLFVTK